MAVIYKASSEPPLSQAWLGGCLYPLPCLEQRPPRGLGFEAVPMGTSWLCTLCDPLALGQGAFQILSAQNEMGPLFTLVLPPE